MLVWTNFCNIPVNFYEVRYKKRESTGIGSLLSDKFWGLFMQYKSNKSLFSGDIVFYLQFNIIHILYY